MMKLPNLASYIITLTCFCTTLTSAGIPAFDDCGPPPPPGGKPGATQVTVGYLAAVTGSVSNRQGRAISGALSYAIEQECVICFLMNFLKGGDIGLSITLVLKIL